jgi:periplasmic protein CpxP/Spy
MKQSSRISQPMLKSFWQVSTMLALMFLVVFSTSAQQRTSAPQKKQMKFEKHAMLPDLTDAQKDQMKAIHLKTMKATQPLKNELMEKKARLNTLSSAENADMKAINRQIDEITAIQGSIQKLKASGKQEVRSILTEDQRVIFDTKRGISQRQNGHGMKNCDGNGPHQKMRRNGSGR